MIPCSYLRLVDGQASPLADEHAGGRVLAHTRAAFAPPVPSLPQTQDAWLEYFRRARCPDCAIMRDKIRFLWIIVADLVAVILIAWAIRAGVMQ